MLKGNATAEDETATQARVQLLDLIGRMREEYNLDEAGLLSKVQRRLPDATADDIRTGGTTSNSTSA